MDEYGQSILSQEVKFSYITHKFLFSKKYLLSPDTGQHILLVRRGKCCLLCPTHVFAPQKPSLDLDLGKHLQLKVEMFSKKFLSLFVTS